ncbi:hypothetical protein [Desulfoferula mesophila]|uniref:Uncharacterized protein n=1 Tax=Desulfoferula mesophila TaxID=3058419 RepID=A0AAU9F156_9BACT|nr:hypothetical protein FAK_08930 [Desulfoferula mesophilus]
MEKNSKCDACIFNKQAVQLSDEHRAAIREHMREIDKHLEAVNALIQPKPKNRRRMSITDLEKNWG